MEESTKEVAAVIKNYARKYFESRTFTNQLTSNLDKEVNDILVKIEPEQLSNEIFTRCRGRR